MNAQELITRITALNAWKQGDQHAPRKPLLLALTRINPDKSRLSLLDEIENKLSRLLENPIKHEVYH